MNNDIVLFDSVIDTHGNEIRKGGEDVRSNDYQVITYVFEWHHLAITTRYELHTEYLTVAAFIDISLMPKLNSKQTLTNLRADDAIFGGTMDHMEKLDRLTSSKERDASKYSETHRFLYRDIWDKLSDELFLPCMPQDRKRLGSTFVDFRAIIAGSPASGNQSDGVQVFSQPPLHRTDYDDDEPIVDIVARPLPPTPTWAADKLDRLWPFFISESDVVDFKKYQFTASKMLDGHALYVTALGPQPQHNIPSQGGHWPLLYFIYSNTLNRWQVGRLVDRIHHLGTVRIAAIWEMEKLRKAGQALRVVEQDLDDAFREIQMIVQAASPISDKLYQLLARIHRRISDLRQDFAGDLAYRVERSRYYVKQFGDGIPMLRIGRLEGFQPYDYFVRWRLGAAFEFINMLGLRYERTMKELSLLNQTFQTQQASEISSNILRRDADIEDLQAVGELVLFIVLLPYYASMIAEHLLLSPPKGINQIEGHDRRIWAVAMLVGFVFGVVRFIHIRHRELYHRLVHFPILPTLRALVPRMLGKICEWWERIT
jgi:hypothetical protein